MMSRSVTIIHRLPSGTTPSSCAPAAFCRRHFSETSASSWRPNMAVPRSACIAFAAAFLLQTPAPGVRLAFGGETPDGHDAHDDSTARSIDSALVTGQFKQAAALLARRANAGSADARYQLASLYRLGRGVPQDEALAFKWMKAAAEQGHVRAEFNLGTMYLAGRGVDRDIGRARTWLVEAAARGSQEARLLLAGLATGSSKETAGSKSTAPVMRGAPDV